MTEQFVAAPRDRRINLRTSQRQEAVLKQAARAADTSLTDFVLKTAMAEAERVLADRRWFVATPEQYEEFLDLLDKPVETPRLAALLAAPSPFEEANQI